MEESQLMKNEENFFEGPYYTYLCGPMHFKTHDEMAGWRNYVKSKLDDCYDPVEREIDKHDVNGIVERDLIDIEASNFLIVNYDGESPSVGSSMEMFFASHNVSPSRLIITVTDCEEYSAFLTYHSDLILKKNGFEGFDKATQIINQMKNLFEQRNNEDKKLNEDILDILSQ